MSNEPYNLKIKHEDNYIILKYNIGTDFSYPMMLEARGIILKQEFTGEYTIVCHPFDKFFNYGESFAANIDWPSAIVREKVDGSLLKIWFDEKWHVSTNGCVNAYAAPVMDKEFSFGEMFEKAIIHKNDFLSILNPDKIYLFELVGPENQLVVSYSETALYYLGERDRISNKEEYNYNPLFAKYNIKEPRKYALNNLNDVLTLVNSFDDNQEGCVVCDKYYNRIKIKGKEYLKAFFYRCQNTVSTKRIVTAILNETIDDWISYSVAIKERYDIIMNKLHNIGNAYEKAYDKVSQKDFDTQKELAIYVKKHFPNEAAYIFTRQHNPQISGINYLMRCSRACILRLLKQAEK